MERQRSESMLVVNHAIGGTTTGGRAPAADPLRSRQGRAQRAHSVGGTTRFQAEVLGVQAPLVRRRDQPNPVPRRCGHSRQRLQAEDQRLRLCVDGHQRRRRPHPQAHRRRDRGEPSMDDPGLDRRRAPGRSLHPDDACAADRRYPELSHRHPRPERPHPGLGVDVRHASDRPRGPRVGRQRRSPGRIPRFISATASTTRSRARWLGGQVAAGSRAGPRPCPEPRHFGVLANDPLTGPKQAATALAVNSGAPMSFRWSMSRK